MNTEKLPLIVSQKNVILKNVAHVEPIVAHPMIANALVILNLKT
jgi:hypothetical protein